MDRNEFHIALLERKRACEEFNEEEGWPGLKEGRLLFWNLGLKVSLSQVEILVSSYSRVGVTCL